MISPRRCCAQVIVGSGSTTMVTADVADPNWHDEHTHASTQAAPHEP
ncbi:MAG: hypothetical protein JO272_03215 [Pseudonocardiales bacterium]|nr:hypothetical protein [Pseudonocardiales bacterium]